MGGHKFRAVCLLSLMSVIASAGGEAVRVILTQESGTKLQLEARQQPLAEIVKKITDATGVPIHYSVLPNELITAVCAGATVQQVLECLFDKKADLIFRYAKNASKNVAQNRPEEVWVLGTSFGTEKADTTAERLNPVEATQVETGGVDDLDILLDLAKNQDPAQRADAVAGLAAIGQVDDGTVNSALVSALSDKSAVVRAQAVSGLASRKSADAPAALQNAMQDSDASVRLMALDYAGDNIALLQQALGDSDQTVRAYAVTKWAELFGAGKVR